VNLRAEAQHVLDEHLRPTGLKKSSRRNCVLNVFLATRDHTQHTSACKLLANNQRRRISIFFGLCSQVALVTHFLDLMYLRLQPIDMALFIFEQLYKEIAGAVVLILHTNTY
jgi:hypothetical protein